MNDQKPRLSYEDTLTCRRSKISVVIITLNEEKNIVDCLESVKWADEIVVVDSNSSDKTVEICKRYTDKVFQEENVFSKKWNLGLRKATGDWVLIMGADERVRSALRDEIKNAVESPRFDGYFIPTKNIVLGRWVKNAGWYPAYHLRLFKREMGSITDREVHESFVITGRKGKLRHPILHLGVPTVSTAWKKYDFATSLEVKQKIKEGETFSVFKFLVYPYAQFLDRFFLKRGFRDGCRGYFVSMNYAFYEFIEQAKFWEKTLKKEETSY